MNDRDDAGTHHGGDAERDARARRRSTLSADQILELVAEGEDLETLNTDDASLLPQTQPDGSNSNSNSNSNSRTLRSPTSSAGRHGQPAVGAQTSTDNRRRSAVSSAQPEETRNALDRVRCKVLDNGAPHDADSVDRISRVSPSLVHPHAQSDVLHKERSASVTSPAMTGTLPPASVSSPRPSGSPLAATAAPKSLPSRHQETELPLTKDSNHGTGGAPVSGVSSVHRSVKDKLNSLKDDTKHQTAEASAESAERNATTPNFQNNHTSNSASIQDDHKTLDINSSYAETDTSITDTDDYHHQTPVGAFQGGRSSHLDRPNESSMQFSLDDRQEREASIDRQPIIADIRTVAELAPTQDEMRDALRGEILQEFELRVDRAVQQRLETQRPIMAQAVTVSTDEVERGHASTKKHVNSTKTAKIDTVARPTSKLRKILAGIACLLATTAVAAAVSIVLLQNSDSSSSSDKDASTGTASGTVQPTANPSLSLSQLPSTAPSQPPTVSLPSAAPSYFINQSNSFYAIIDVLSPKLFRPPTSFSPSVFADPNTVPYKTLDWMANADSVSATMLSSLQSMSVSLSQEERANVLQQLLERYVLASMYWDLDGPNWRRRFNFLSEISVCQWKSDGYGVFCSSRGFVQGLWMAENDLAGPVPSQLYHLSHLQDWSMAGNPDLSGTISTWIGTLTNLAGFEASLSKLSGTIPTELWSLSDLWIVVLFGTRIEGTLPTEIGYATNLEQIGVAHARLVGTIPSEVGLLAKLTLFGVNGNDVSGTLPTEFHELTNLDTVDFAMTQIYGDLDPFFCQDPSTYRTVFDLWSDCGGSTIDGSQLSHTVCSCCVGCCDPFSAICEMMPPPDYVIPECADGAGCVTCYPGIVRRSCQECPYIDGSGDIVDAVPDAAAAESQQLTRACSNTCMLNMTTNECNRRTVFEDPTALDR